MGVAVLTGPRILVGDQEVVLEFYDDGLVCKVLKTDKISFRWRLGLRNGCRRGVED